jgi:CheY-like chemotaxis protein
MFGRLLTSSFRLGGRSLLVVDQPSEAREQLAAALRNEGADVTVCGSAWEALLALQLETFSAVLARLDLAPRDGFWLLERARAEAHAFPESASVPFVALDEGEGGETRAFRAGFAAYHDMVEAPEGLVQGLAEALPPDSLTALAREAAEAKLIANGAF